MRCQLLILLFFALATLCAQAQTTLRGKVTSLNGEPLAGVNIFNPVNYEGATTDSAGTFAFTSSATPPYTLLTQYLGYRSDSFKVRSAADTLLRFRLRQTATALSEVVVSAGAFVASDTRKVAVLSSVDVATTGATADLVEAMNTLPGSTPAGESGQLLVRGGSAAETQAYINGLRVPNLYTSRLPDVPSRTRFSPFAFKGITFASGGFSAQYGDALSAALILETQDMPEQSLTAVSLMTLGGDITHTQLLGDDQAFALGVGGMHLGAYTQLNAEARDMLVQSPQGLNAQAGYWWKGKDGRNLKVFAQASNNAYAAENSGQSNFYGGNRLSLSNQNLYAQARYQQASGRTGLWELGAAIGANRDLFGIDGSGKQIDQQDLQLRAVYSDNFKDIALWRAGVEQQARHEQVAVQPQANERMFEVGDVNRHYSAAFAEADWYLDTRWVLRTGLRADAYLDGAGSFLSPRAQLSYLFSASHQLAFSTGRYMQRQTADELVAIDHQLRAVSLNHYGLTYSRTWDNRVLRAEAYAKTYAGLKTNTTAGLGANGNGFSQGFDLFYRDRQSVRNADFWISYSFNQAERLRDDLTERAPVPFAARHNVAFVAKRFWPEPGFGVNLTYQWHSGRPYDDPNTAVRFGGVTPQFHNLSVNVTYLTKIAGHFTVIFASMSNLTGARQIHQYRFAQSPDTAGNYARLDVNPLFPRFPFAGMFISIGDKDREGTIDDI